MKIIHVLIMSIIYSIQLENIENFIPAPTHFWSDELCLKATISCLNSYICLIKKQQLKIPHKFNYVNSLWCLADR